MRTLEKSGAPQKKSGPPEVRNFREIWSFPYLLLCLPSDKMCSTSFNVVHPSHSRKKVTEIKRNLLCTKIITPLYAHFPLGLYPPWYSICFPHFLPLNSCYLHYYSKTLTPHRSFIPTPSGWVCHPRTPPFSSSLRCCLSAGV